MEMRNITKVVGAIAVVLLIYLVNPWVVPPEGTVRDVVTWGFWIAFIALLVLLFTERRTAETEVTDIEGPAFTRFLFSNTQAGLFWLPIRIFLGFSWLESGWGKFSAEGNAWLAGGAPLRQYWERAVAIPEEGRPPISFEWYRGFIQLLLDNGAESWFSYLIVFGELAAGIGLIVGALTGIAAFGGALMNMSFLLAGSASTNPVMFTLAIGVILAWKVAGFYGVDRWLLPMLGTPWRPGALAGQETRPMGAPSS